MRVSRNAVAVLVVEFAPRMGIDLSQWRIKVAVYRTEDDCPEDQRDAEAFSIVHSGYRNATICINAHRIKSRVHLRWAVAHETAHVHTDEVASVIRKQLGDDLAEPMVERLTESFARLLVPEAADLWSTRA